MHHGPTRDRTRVFTDRATMTRRKIGSADVTMR
jgi:hypothetical protein